MKPPKTAKWVDFEAELGESISFPLKVIPEYPNKISIVHNEAIYYIYKLVDRMVIKRSIIENTGYQNREGL